MIVVWRFFPWTCCLPYHSDPWLILCAYGAKKIWRFHLKMVLAHFSSNHEQLCLHKYASMSTSACASEWKELMCLRMGRGWRSRSRSSDLHDIFWVFCEGDRRVYRNEHWTGRQERRAGTHPSSNTRQTSFCDTGLKVLLTSTLGIMFFILKALD